MRRALFAVTFCFAAACGGDSEWVEQFDAATAVEDCAAPTRLCEEEVERDNDCDGVEVCEAQAVAECRRLGAQCRWRIEQPDAPFPCPTQVCGEACTALDGTEKACGADFTCTDAPQCM